MASCGAVVNLWGLLTAGTAVSDQYSVKEADVMLMFLSPCDSASQIVDNKQILPVLPRCMAGLCVEIA